VTLQVSMQHSNFLNVKQILRGGEGGGPFVKGVIFNFLPIFNPPTLS